MTIATTDTTTDAANVTTRGASQAGDYLAAALMNSSTDVGEHFTCREADGIAAALILLGQHDAAADWLAGHSHGDSEGDVHYWPSEHPRSYDDDAALARAYAAANLANAEDTAEVAGDDGARAPISVEILHDRDPDSRCKVRLFLDGTEVPAELQDVDPGSGWAREDWTAARPTSGSAAFLRAAQAAWDAAADSEHITGDDDFANAPDAP